MKKVLAMVLALVMVLSLSTVALASGGSTPGGAGSVSGNTSGDVTVEVTGVVGDTDIYYVVIDWNGGLNFTYDFAEESKVWDPNEHDYVVNTGTPHWVSTSANIKVTNHSSKAITANAEFADGGISKTVNGVTATVSVPSATVAAPAPGSDFNAAPTGILTVSISNNAPTVKDGFTIGTIKITIS